MIIFFTLLLLAVNLLQVRAFDCDFRVLSYYLENDRLSDFNMHIVNCQIFAYAVGSDDVEALLKSATQKGLIPQVMAFLVHHQQSIRFEQIMLLFLDAVIRMEDWGLFELLIETIKPPFALKVAASTGSFEHMRWLIQRGWSLEYADDRGISVLKAAISSGNIDTVQFLIDQGVDTSTGSPLGYAIYCRNFDAAERLLRHGADITAVHHGHSLLQSAIATGDTKLISLINCRLLRLTMLLTHQIDSTQ